MTSTTHLARKAASPAGRWTRMAVVALAGAVALLLAGQPGLTAEPTSAQAAPNGVGPASDTAGLPPYDAGAMTLVTETTGARAYWRAGFTGKGVDIAIIDSGIAPVEGLSTPDKVILGPDLSFESQDPSTRYLDTNGHGTHLAGIAAGRDAAASGDYSSDVTNFLGMAPDARVLSVKVADSMGRTDVSQVIAAIDWVVQHRNDNGLNVRVLLLAFGTDSAAGWRHDPLVFAAEQAWKNGVFVVVSAGNDGPAAKQSGSLSNLASSENLFVVGATDTAGTTSLRDDVVAPFSSGGNTDRWVDVVAPGSHIISLKAPGSYAEQNHGATGAYGDRFFRGSGTSQAAAVAAGAAALVIEQRPTITPAELNGLLKMKTTYVKDSMFVQGSGALDLTKVFGFRTQRVTGSWTEWSDGLGTLQDSRGSTRLVHSGVALEGEMDIFGAPWDSATMAGLEASASSWSGGTWNGNEWSASSWSASSWSASSWSASSWSASSWSTGGWY